AATMVAAGVFLVARVYPLMEVVGQASSLPELAGKMPAPLSLQVVTWVGAITAVFAALIAVAQTDIKRILAYSTVSQLGFMFLGLGAGGVAVGMFPPITHAFFKALLFLGAGSVIHGCHEEQDIRRMGGLRKFMPVTFVTYAIGMMALSGFPLLFSGFWSKDEILHSAWLWQPSKIPFVLGAFGALLTAFYMTRQMCYVFFSESRAGFQPASGGSHGSQREHEESATQGRTGSSPYSAHESPPVMTVPLVVLAVFAVLLGFIGTPAWPWFQSFLGAHHEASGFSAALPTMLLSTVIVAIGIGAGWWIYGRKPVERAEQPDALETAQPQVFTWLRNKFFVDELYAATVIWLNAWWSGFCDALDRLLWSGAVRSVALAVLALSWLSRFFDEYVVNFGFDEGCRSLRSGGGLFSAMQDGKAQNYLRVIGFALTLVVLFLVWGSKGK
ncbi:MAG: NADH-quinone oxidoreductase subunit L, partial [Verrucomicrobia bacterium]|nr:NADH-quinone oxidoreductase subunit L [Verrucomicrobiota bacterium]